MKSIESKTRLITNVGLGVAAMIGGGFAIYQISSIFPLPGMKYIMMAPYLSMVIYILIVRVRSRFALLLIGGVFGGIMALINVIMGLSIFATALAAQLIMLPIKPLKIRAAVGATAFGGFSGIISILISRVFIDIYKQVSYSWMVIALIIATLFGALGAYFASKIMKHITRGISSS